jgi:DNA polymerase-3 subunit delta
VKLAGARAAAFCARPDLRLAGALLHGPDAGLLAIRRRELVATLTQGDDLRLSRIEPTAALKDPAGIDAALKARGFFPGRRVVLIEGAKDGLAALLGQILADSAPEDAFLVLTAEGLAPRSALRRLFEGSGNLAALGLYPEAPGAAELREMLAAAGMGCRLEPDASELLTGTAAELDRGTLLQLVERIAVHCLGRTEPLGREELAGLLPLSAESEVDRLVGAVAEGRTEAVGPLIGRLSAAGIGPVAMLIAAERHFRRLMALAASGDGIEAALGRLRPPAFGPQRQALAGQARRWGLARLEAAGRILFQADRSLRSAGYRPDRALVERCLLRLAMMAGRG